MNALPTQNNRGVALVVTLAIIAVALTVALEINRQARSDATAASVSLQRFTLSQMAASGIHLAMALLVRDRLTSTVDSVQETWAGSLTSYLADFPLRAGRLEVGIADERAKIQVNALVRYPEGRQVNPAQYRIWIRFAQQLANTDTLPNPVDPVGIVNSLIDWLDRGDSDMVTALTGAESDYYLSLDPPYRCRNGPIAHLGELALIKGMSRELLEAAGGVEGIFRYLTVYGTSPTDVTFDGRINLNTADVPVLAAILPESHSHLARAMADYRTALADTSYLHSLNADDWYRRVPGAEDLSIDSALTTLASDTFKIVATAFLNERRLSVAAVVRREKDPESDQWKCRVLQWEEE